MIPHNTFFRNVAIDLLDCDFIPQMDIHVIHLQLRSLVDFIISIM